MLVDDVKQKINDYVQIVNQKLVEYLPDAKYAQDEVVSAMKYSLINGGKRLRPILVLEFCKACGGNADFAMPFACAVEYVHTYSLIHDDLPCMDDDNLRRGKPSCHKMYGEATALLAGDALLTHAFEILQQSDLDCETISKATLLLAQNAGVGGMIGGQVLDLKYENYNPTLNQIITVDKLKTGALISASCLLGCIAGGASEKQLSCASKYAYNLGIAFQIQDDILDVLGDENKLGKPIGSDVANDKTTYISLVGIEKAKQDVESLTNNAISQLSSFDNSEFLKAFSKYLINREK